MQGRQIDRNLCPAPEIPAPLRTSDIALEDGAIIHLRQHGNPAGPRLVLSHGNGLAVDGYLPFWNLLRDRYELILFDFRNHGQNPLAPDLAHHTWPTLVRDMERIWCAIHEHFGAKPTAGVFHSLSSVCAVRHALEFGRRWEILILFDPPIPCRDGCRIRQSAQEEGRNLAARARRRTEYFASPSDLARQYARYEIFRRWVTGAYELVARATLRPDPVRGGWTLACPRELEARIFESNRDPTLWPRLRQMPQPVKLVCGDPDLPEATAPTLTGQAIAADIGIPYEAIAQTTHFLQIERPVECVRAMESFLREHRFGL